MSTRSGSSRGAASVWIASGVATATASVAAYLWYHANRTKHLQGAKSSSPPRTTITTKGSLEALPGTPPATSHDDEEEDAHEICTPVASNAQQMEIETPILSNVQHQGGLGGGSVLSLALPSAGVRGVAGGGDPSSGEAGGEEDDELLLSGGDACRQDVLDHSKAKLEETAKWLRPYCGASASASPKLQPCDCGDEAVGYRCRFTLQVLRNSQNRFMVATRHQGTPVPLANNWYDIANAGLQELLQNLMQQVNNNAGNFAAVATPEWTSLSLASSWDSFRTRLVTFHYRQPLTDQAAWQRQAKQLQQACGATVISGRAKKQLWRTPTENGAVPENGSVVGTLDELLLQEHLSWKVTTLCSEDEEGAEPTAATDHSENNHHHHHHHHEDRTDGIVVQLFKPEGAFCHPNADVMQRALTWILNRLAWIRRRHSYPVKHLSLLELYCGCGAHTVPLAKSGLLSSLTAVELDERLVQACRDNLKRNQLLLDDPAEQPPHEHQEHTISEAVQVDVISDDAARWAVEQLRLQKEQASGSGNHNHNPHTVLRRSSSATAEPFFDILLVDPPRQGLDEAVLNLALHASDLRDVIYISCGREALVRDLTVLTRSGASSFEVVNCTLLDLFPGTRSVESLVHLRRR